MNDMKPKDKIDSIRFNTRAEADAFLQRVNDMNNPLNFPCERCGALEGQPCHTTSGVKTQTHIKRMKPRFKIESIKFNTRAEAEAFLRGVYFMLLARLESVTPVGVIHENDQFFAMVQLTREK